MKSTAIALNEIRNLRNEQTKNGYTMSSYGIGAISQWKKKITDHMIDDVSKER